MIEPGDRVKKIGSDSIGIAKSLPRGNKDLVTVYWGTSDGEGVFSVHPAKELVRLGHEQQRLVIERVQDMNGGTGQEGSDEE